MTITESKIVGQLIDSICKENDFKCEHRFTADGFWYGIINKNYPHKNPYSAVSAFEIDASLQEDNNIKLICKGMRITINIADPEFAQKLVSWIQMQYTKCKLIDLITSI